MDTNNTYRNNSLYPLNEKGEFQHKIKLINPNNNTKTHYLDITYEEFIKICDILNGEGD